MGEFEGFETTPYFQRRVLNNPQRQHLLPHIVKTINEYEDMEIQRDGKIRHYRYVEELSRHIRVITTADGALFDAFEDSNYTRKRRHKE